MTVFKTFLKVLKSCRLPIILYTVLLVVFGGINLQTGDTSTMFVESKPKILIVNNDVNEGITKSLIDYVKKNSREIAVEDNENARKDALFYRDVNYIVYIPEDFRNDFLNNKNPKLQIQTTGDYQASLAEMMIKKYIKIASSYNASGLKEEQIIKQTSDTLAKEAEVELTTKLDTNSLSKAAAYFNFSNYSLLAGCIYVICLVLSSFKSQSIRKRTIISSMNYKVFNRKLLLSNSLFAFVLWAVYATSGYFLIGDAMLSIHGILILVNSFILTMCAVTMAFFIANVITNKEAINGIVNVIALGSSFLCGAFVPLQWLPSSVVKIAHIFPSYYFISNNDTISKLEIINISTLKPVLINMGIMILFVILFIVLTNVVSKKKQKI